MTNRLFVCGDTHIPSDIQKLSMRNFPEQKQLTKDDVLVQLGDFGGLWYPIGTNKEQEYWLDWLANKNFTTAVVLGNHENYDIIETLPWETKWGNDVQYYEIENGNKIYFLKRGATYNINGKKILAIGGANSIDKAHRQEGVSWWAKEDITYAEIENCFQDLDINGYEVDYVLTHTCPSRLVMEFIFITEWNAGKKKCATAEFLDEIDNRVTFKEWHFGHMHMDYRHIDKTPETIPEYRKMHGDEEYTDGVYHCHYNNSPHELV